MIRRILSKVVGNSLFKHWYIDWITSYELNPVLFPKFFLQYQSNNSPNLLLDTNFWCRVYSAVGYIMGYALIWQFSKDLNMRSINVTQPKKEKNESITWWIIIAAILVHVPLQSPMSNSCQCQHTCMRTFVNLQVFTSGKHFATARITAKKWFFTGMHANMVY